MKDLLKGGEDETLKEIDGSALGTTKKPKYETRSEGKRENKRVCNTIKE